MQVGDFGYVQQIVPSINLKLATDVLMKIVREDNTTFSRTFGAGDIDVDGSIKWVVNAGELTVDGNYSGQLINLTSGVEEASEVFTFYVGPKL